MSKTCLSLDALEIIKGDFSELSTINSEQCCEFIQKCQDTEKYLRAREKVDKNDDEEYLNLVDQIINLCSHRSELEAGSLSCLLRNKYLRYR